MTYPLPADIVLRIQEQLKTGGFNSEEEVLREAIDALERRQQGLSHLRQLLSAADADAAAGRIGPFDREAIKQDVRARLAERGIQ